MAKKITYGATCTVCDFHYESSAADGKEVLAYCVGSKHEQDTGHKVVSGEIESPTHALAHAMNEAYLKKRHP